MSGSTSPFQGEKTGSTPVSRSGAPVAQWIEQSRSKRMVGSSTLSRGAMVAVAQWLERLPVEEDVGGSNPLSHPI